jgi:hypothetical protein
VNLWIILSVLFAVLITGTDGITSHVSCAGHGFGAEKSSLHSAWLVTFQKGLIVP